MSYTTPEDQLASMLDFYATERQKAQDAGLWFEIRYWSELPEGHVGIPSHWMPIAYATLRSSAGIVADSLHRTSGLWCEVWTCDPTTDRDSYRGNGKPVRWHLCDVFYERRY
jgi:hypothetical protein